MPWKELSTVDARNAFIDAYLTTEATMTDLCAEFGISRKTGYKWVTRYDQEGRQGLRDRSRAPTSRPSSTSDTLVELLVATRKRHPKWGPRKLKALLERRHPELRLPAASTIGLILKRHGLVPPPKREKRAPLYPSPLAAYERPNKIWCADFKGQIRLVAGRRCNPLTISDGHTRYLLRCEALSRTDVSVVKPIFESAFCQFGLPEMIRTDNGPPFASRAPGGLSQLSIWWLKLGIVHERIEPGKPTQNGRHERIHRTLALEACGPPLRTLAVQQRAFDRFRHEYNDLRPHEALDNATPSDFYEPSARRFPKRLQEPKYPEHYETRLIRHNGEFKWRGKIQFLSETLRGERIGLHWNDEARGWVVEYGDMQLGVINTKNVFKRPRDQRRRPRSQWRKRGQ